MNLILIGLALMPYLIAWQLLKRLAPGVHIQAFDNLPNEKLH